MKIAVLPGDGIGPEVVEVALNVTKEVCKNLDMNCPMNMEL